MTTHLTKPAGHIELIPAQRDEQPIVANLLELYIHDFSEFLDVEIGADGRFGYRDLPLYWSDPDRRPFVVRVDGKLAGLVFIRSFPHALDNQVQFDMAEFFILRGYRKRGLGTKAAHRVWREFPGRWQVRVMESNASALEFWPRAISSYLGKAINPVRVEKEGKFWQFFVFDSREQA